MTVAIFTEEGEKIVVLTDVSDEITEDELFELYQSKLTSELMKVVFSKMYSAIRVSELVDILDGVDDPTDIKQLKAVGFVVVKRTLNQYIRDFVKWYDEIGFEDVEE